MRHVETQRANSSDVKFPVKDGMMASELSMLLAVKVPIFRLRRKKNSSNREKATLSERGDNFEACP